MTPTLRLHEITAEFEQVERFLIDNQGELTPEVEDTLVWLEEQLDAKAEGYMAVILNMEAEAKAYDAEAERLKKNAAVLGTAAAMLKGRIKEAMISTGKEEIRTRLGRFKIQQAGGKAPVELLVPVDDLPDEYRRVKVEPDKGALASALENGDKTAEQFARFGERGKYLRIY